MKKLLKFGVKYSMICIIALTLFFVLAVNTRPTISAESGEIYNITVSVGETYETSGINYHCSEDGSYVIYGTDSSLSSYNTVQSVSKVWGIEQDPDDAETGFADRYVCKANLTGLQEDTTYYYQVISGTNKSDVLSFVTPKASGSNSILFLTDTQSSNLSTFAKINTLVTNIEKQVKDLNTVLITGDIVDRGGYEAQWDALFGGLTTLQRYQQATIPGNHEYYHTNDPAYIDSSIYNQFYNNPQNGPDDRMNSSYYFTNGDILFIMLDIMPNTQDDYDLESNIAWFKQVVENNPKRWIIVGSHAGAITAGIYDHDAKQIWNKWHETFEECQVDLALSGHEHIYLRKDLWYQDGKNEELGVTYLVGPAAGQKDYPIQSTEGLDAAMRGNYRGNVITVRGETMTVTLYEQTGEVVTSFELKAKRSNYVAEMTDEQIIDSVYAEYDESTGLGKIGWSTDLWGIVKSVTCTGDREWTQTIPSCAESFACRTLNGLNTTLNYNFTLTFNKLDGTSISTDVQLLLNPDLLPGSIAIEGNNKLNVGETSQLTIVATPEGADTSVTWTSADESIATVDENGLVTAVSAGKVRITATSKVKPSVKRLITITVAATAVAESFTIGAFPEQIIVGDEFTIPVIVTPLDASKDATWTTSDPKVAQITGNTIHILGAGEVTITGVSKSNPELKAAYTFTAYNSVDEIPTENPGSSGGSTCNMGVNVKHIISITMAASLAAILIRKRK